MTGPLKLVVHFSWKAAPLAALDEQPLLIGQVIVAGHADPA